MSVQPRRVLSTEDALRFIAAEDPRPLLVLRECVSCNGTDDALLTRQENNERTFLLSRWFHCVKLPPAVTEADHPFHALFAGDAAPHLFVVQRDGAERIELKGDRSRAELWKAMNSTLALAYEKVSNKGPKKPLGELFKLLDKLDQLDAQLTQKQRRLEQEEEKAGQESRKALRFAQEILVMRGERSRLRRDAMKASTLKLRVLDDAPEEVVGATQGK